MVVPQTSERERLMKLLVQKDELEARIKQQGQVLQTVNKHAQTNNCIINLHVLNILHDKSTEPHWHAGRARRCRRLSTQRHRCASSAERPPSNHLHAKRSESAYAGH